MDKLFENEWCEFHRVSFFCKTQKEFLKYIKPIFRSEAFFRPTKKLEEKTVKVGHFRKEKKIIKK